MPAGTCIAGMQRTFVRLWVKSYTAVAAATLRTPSHLETEDMQLRRIHRRLAVVAFGLGAAGLALAAPARAQEPTQQTQAGSRYRVLIPNLEHPQGVDDGFGKTVAEDLRKAIDKLPTHVSVSKDEVKDNLKKFHVNEKELDCIKSRQLAVQIGAELVMCGSYEPAAGGQMKVSASFVGAKNGETFEVPAFTAARPEDAAAQVFSAFDKYVAQLRSLAICQQYLGSQQWPSALQNCNAALAINSQSATALYYKATALMNMDSLAASLDALRQVVKINPMQAEAMRTAGVVAAKMDSSALSTDFFRQYLELNPGDANVRINLANDAAKAGNPEGALKMLEEGFKADSANPTLLLFAGHWSLQASQKAEAAARKAGDDKAPKADSLALVALNYYTRLIALEGDTADPVVVRNAVLIMTSHNQAAQAAQLASKYLAVRHDDAALWSAYADALESQNQFQQALAALDSAGVYDKKGELPLAPKRGQWLAERGQLSAAKAALQQAVQSGKITADDAANLVLLIGVRDHMSKGDNDGAINYFEAAKDLTDNALTRGTANYYTGTILFQRANAAQKGAQTPAAREKVAAIYVQARRYLSDTDAFVARNPRVRDGLAQMLKYITTYTEAVRAASR